MIERSFRFAARGRRMRLRRRPREGRARVVRDAFSYRSAQVAAVGFAFVLFLALAGPYLAPKPPTAIEGLPFGPPTGGHWLGFDYLGRDGLSRFLAGGRSVVMYGLAAAVLGSTAGVVLGLVAAYSRNWMDEMLMRIGDVIMAFPSLILVLIVVAGVGPHLWVIIVTVAVTFAPRVMRVARGATLEVIAQPYVEAAEARGEPTRVLLAREVLPNVLTPLLVDFGIRLANAVIIVASLSFLGLGIQPPASDWGLMINENRGALTIDPWLIVAPVLAIGLLCVSVNLLGDGLSRALGGQFAQKDLVK